MSILRLDGPRSTIALGSGSLFRLRSIRPGSIAKMLRAKVNRQASLTIMADADDIRVTANKKKRNENQEDSDHDGNHYAIEPGRIDLKRKREPEPDAIVDLGPSNLRILNPNLYSSALRRRLSLGSSPKG